MPSFPPDFPPEILARILVHLPYQDLLRGLRVVKQWKALIESYPALRVETFKKASAVYVEKEDGSPGDNTEAGSEKIRMHPVLKDISFGLGDDVSGVTIYHRNGSEIALSDTGVADDLATIPAVHEFTITIEEDLDEFFEFQVEVQNSAGVTVIDIFTQLANA
ncbi:hypothetical protein B0H11DRAFT_826794 [Mycena galericulata]|nr:hypothetical protein B0H11DRAFT_826794 [Mycena galericulata]